MAGKHIEIYYGSCMLSSILFGFLCVWSVVVVIVVLALDMVFGNRCI